MDAALGGSHYADAVTAAQVALQDDDSLPSARVLAAMREHDNSFVRFAREQSVKAQQTLLGLPFTDAQHEAYVAMTQQSVREQKEVEASDSMSFEAYREAYVSASRLVVRSKAPALV